MSVKERFYKLLVLRFFLFFIFFLNCFLSLNANEKQSIINRLLEIDNFTFNFEQITHNKIEKGICFVVFDNKLKCDYVDKKQKKIIINGKRLAIIHKKYNKVYFYPISKSPFVKILNKNSLIQLVRESNLELNDKIDLIYFDKNKKKITIFFEKKNFNLIGWKIRDELRNEIYFSLKIKDINLENKEHLFKIPSIY
jgi:outer membrane lipoprotein-sorting protein